MRHMILSAALFAAVFLPAAPTARATEVSEPHKHDNLTVFLIYGSDRLKGKKILTLKEALEQKKVVLHETGNVQELAIENVSEDELVFVQSGDIVKGGRQDRVLQYDFIVSPKSGKVPIKSFCVEQGRWSKRGGENAGAFESSDKQVAGKDLKLAARLKGDQGQVWAEVAKKQEELSRQVGESVKAPESASSMQLALENEKLQESIKGYTEELAKAIEGRDDAIGFAFAVNGKINSVEIYASAELFRKLWPKLLESAATEALAELKKDQEFGGVEATAVKDLMAETEKAKAEEKQISPKVKMVTREGKTSYHFETHDEATGVNIHDSHLVK